MAGYESGNFRAMDEPKDSLPDQLDETASPSGPPAIASGAGLGFASTQLSPLEERMQKVFMGRDGLRPIWRLVLYFLMYRALRFCLFVLLAYGLSVARRQKVLLLDLDGQATAISCRDPTCICTPLGPVPVGRTRPSGEIDHDGAGARRPSLRQLAVVTGPSGIG